MISSHRLPFVTTQEQGYRLHKLEVFNWGTFDGQVFTVRPAGKSALLIGQNGSGKSTLVDALLTLLVRPGVRNFNVAAGAKKRERDEKTYLRGAYDRGNDETGQGIQVKYLRPKGDQYSVILATFQNDDIGKSFTIAQFMYLASDQSVEKIYCLAEDERSIQNDFRGFTSTDGVLKLLRQRGFRATRTFQEFEGWFAKLTRVKPKAMEVFNQTVAVKDIQRLNDFIRDHMLEPRDWNEKVDQLLGHFSELSEAHEGLVRVRRQRDLLEPVAQHGAEYAEKAKSLEHAEGLLAATDAYFAHKIVAIFTPALEQRSQELTRTRQNKETLSHDIAAVGEQIRKLRNEIDQAGGDRLRQIPSLIELEQTHADSKRTASTRFLESLAKLDISESVEIESTFSDIQNRLPTLLAGIEPEVLRLNSDRETNVLERGVVRRDLAEYRQELESLNQRRENIPQWCVALRERLCGELGLAARELPFAAELLRVDPQETAWESSIEKVLRGFALSMLVPDRYYHVVANHLDSQRLVHQGRGQRLVYLRVTEQAAGASSSTSDPKSLIRKLVFREGHQLLPWVKAELQHRFDYRCCDDASEFQQCRGLAMTVNRHVKSGHQRHDKDDRDFVCDPRNFVLGWDNREKKQRLVTEIGRLTQLDADSTGRIEKIDQQLDQLRGRLAAISEAQRVTTFYEIDFGTHVREIENLNAERQALEENSDAIRLLKQRLKTAETKESVLQDRRDESVTHESDLTREIAQGAKLLSNAESTLKNFESDGCLREHSKWFPDLDAEFAEPQLSTEDLFERKDRFRSEQESLFRRLRDDLNPIQTRLLNGMSKYLQMFPEAANDLQPAVEYLDSFLGLRQRIHDDDLPRHEQRFKERLNQKVIEEIGLFRNALEQERRDIERKIELLNVSLKKLEYRPGTHIQLEPRPMRDPEIAEFQGKLRECVEGSFEDSAAANEARFLRIRELVIQLRDEGNRRWREKVTDVRRWFDFMATVVDRQTLKVVSVYQDSSGQSGGEKAKLAFTILVAAIAYQYDLDPEHPVSDRFHFVVVDEMFSKVDDQYAEYALELFKQFGLQLLIVAPLDAKARVTQPYVGCYLHVVKKENRSAIFEMSAREFENSVARNGELTPVDDFSEP